MGSGQVDLHMIEQALRKVAKSGVIASTVTAHADVLHDWLTTLPDQNAAWVQPVWFIEGILRRCGLFGVDST